MIQEAFLLLLLLEMSLMVSRLLPVILCAVFNSYCTTQWCRKWGSAPHTCRMMWRLRRQGQYASVTSRSTDVDGPFSQDRLFCCSRWGSPRYVYPDIWDHLNSCTSNVKRWGSGASSPKVHIHLLFPSHWCRSCLLCTISPVFPLPACSQTHRCERVSPLQCCLWT